ncbi:MAG: flagellar basal body rod protein FlgB [Clostridiales bacterium]|jgi:flagellar basal-body rod protein FlgB|nr:flagellar basal body rod protein FlgB [Clostridiales bacterium]
MSIVNGNYDLLKKGLDALWLRQKVISGNIANISTPGFIASEVEFEDLFLDILQSGEDRKTINRLVSELEPVIAEDQTSAVNENGNNVDIDGQSVEMARTVLAYQTVTRLIADEISREKYAINEGRR